MTAQPLRVVLIGLGRIAVSYSLDARTRRHFEFATHADVLSAHPELEWIGAADVSSERREELSARFPGVGLVTGDVGALADARPDIAVIATPPASRAEVLDALGPVKAVILEKPIAEDMATARRIVGQCGRSGISVQVNFWRRADRMLRQLAGGELQALIGNVQTASCVYGGGLRNNGIHLVDMARMLLGEISEVQTVARQGVATCPDPQFTLGFGDGVRCAFMPIDFTHYRELCFDIWGTGGRLTILQEGLRIAVARRTSHRALEGVDEVASDQPEWLETGAGTALYDLYDNLVHHLRSGADLWSPGVNALATETVIDAVAKSARKGGMAVGIDVSDL